MVTRFIYFLLGLSFCSVKQKDLCNFGRGYMYYDEHFFVELF